MTFNWFKIFNLIEFNALGLTSKVYEYDLEGIGLKEFLVTKGDYVSILYADILLSIGMSDANPFEFEDYAIYLDASNDVWIGLPVP